MSFESCNALAQDTTTPAANAPQTTTNPPAPFRIARVDDDQVSTLRNLRPGAKMLVYLGASAGAMQADATALSALQNWIKSGGVMAVYSNAATLFGFDLQKARLGNPQQGGQLFGRAMSAVPFGSEPLLWNLPLAGNNAASANLPQIDDSAPQRRNKLSVSDPTEFGAVTVYYELQDGDSLLVSHPTATPLLRVTDLAQPQTNLFASAIASYGNGWVIFLPDQIESDRAQGGQFLNNIVSMASNPPLPVSISAITATANSMSGDSPDYAPLLTELRNRLANKTDLSTNDADATATATANLNLMPAAIPVPASIARSMVNAINAAQSATPPAHAKERVAAVVALWKLQAQLQQSVDYSQSDDNESAVDSNWLKEASDLAPSAREVLFWQGAAAAQDAANVTLPSPRRAAAFAAASKDWNDAAAATPLLAPVAASKTSTLPTGVTAAATATAMFADNSPALLTNWAIQANKAATVTALEPPVVTVIGSDGNGAVIRHFSDDPTLRLALPSIQKLQSLAGQFGWVVPGEEVLVFPNEAALSAYADRLGPLEPSERPLASAFGRYGRVLGNRILMVSQPSQPIILPGVGNIPQRVIQTGTAAAAIVGRLHGELLLNALTEDGTSAPVWMRLGIMNLASDAVTVEDNANQRPDQDLVKAGQANQLLSPDQFNAGVANNNTSSLADLQSRSLMSYFYQQFGSGAVMETAQRLGSGEDIDQALQATTQMNESGFFAAWYKALLRNA
ncbi:MAG: hypothetical protein ABI210_04320 [Abditibacteriaceae bacterium]